MTRQLRRNPCRRAYRGSSLLEVLIAILILSFGLLSLGGIMSYAVQMPKMSGNRAAAVTLAAGMIERMRANKAGFIAATGTTYTTALTYDGTITVTAPANPCSYPNCASDTLALWDGQVFQQQLRMALPAGGYQITPTSTGATQGNLWIVWSEPATFGGFDTTSSDNCPSTVTSSMVPRPRCLYVPFSL
jgi:type IV pilus assembly protein PilV